MQENDANEEYDASSFWVGEDEYGARNQKWHDTAASDRSRILLWGVG